MKTLLKEINRRYFRDNPVRFKMKFEGQGLTDNNLYLLGGRAGPIDCISIEYLLHEMCHLAEREKDKLIEKPASSWGFSLGKFWQINNQSGWECSTDQAVLREARVWSYQLSLARALDYNLNAQSLVESAQYLPAFCYFKYKRVKDSKLKFDEMEQEALFILANLVEEQTKQYTFEEFEKNWFERMELLKI